MYGTRSGCSILEKSSLSGEEERRDRERICSDPSETAEPSTAGFRAERWI